MYLIRRYLGALLAACWLSVVAAPAQEKTPVEAMLVTLQNPLNDGQISRIKASVDRVRTNPKSPVKIVVFDFNPEGKEAATDSYGPCYELAKYIKQLTQNGITTMAFVHGKVTRHSVLPVLACDELVMSAGGAIGEVGARDRTVTRAEMDYYLELAGLRRAGAVLKMMDRDVKLVKGKYKEADIFVDLRRIDAKDPAYVDVTVTNRSPVPLSGGYELYNTTNAYKFLELKVEAETLDILAEKFDFANRGGWKDTDPIGEGGIKACRIMVEGEINDRMRGKLHRQIEMAKGRKENYFFFVLECEGGNYGEAAKIADEIIALGKDPNYKARTIAFIPNKAANVATYLAFACQEIVMYKGPDSTGEATLGDFEAYLSDRRLKANADFVRRMLEKITNERGVPDVLVEGMFNKEVVIVNARNNKTNERRLMTEAEMQADPDKIWVRESVVKEKGVLLKLNASKAKNLRLASVVDNKDINEVYARYGVEAKSVREAEPSWLDHFGGFLRRLEVTVLLVVIGIAGLVLELKAPGLIVPGVVAAICFILFFWSQTQLGGQLIYLAIMLFILGLVLLSIEIFFIPGFGFAGVSGILLILAGLVMAGMDKTPETSDEWFEVVGRMIRYGLTMAGAVVLSFVLSRFLPKIPYANRLILVPPEDKIDMEEDVSPLPGVDQAVSLLGHVGTATSMLRPAGMAKFDDRYVDVVTEGDFIEPGTPVQVVEVEGTRIVVKRV